jgi:hypothetical protein
MAFSGFIPGSSAWISAPPRSTDERVALLSITTIGLASPTASAAASAQIAPDRDRPTSAVVR